MIYIYLLILFSIFSWDVTYAADCDFWLNSSIGTALDNCLSDTDLVDPGNALIESWVKQKLLSWTTALWGLLWLLAVWAVVYGAFLMTVSGWDDERIKKGKDIVKWSLIGFFALIAAWSILRLVTEVIFGVA